MELPKVLSTATAAAIALAMTHSTAAPSLVLPDRPLRYVMYLTGQHYVLPPKDQLVHITHVPLAFMNSAIFNEDDRVEWPLFATVEEVREQFHPGTEILVAIGGWGDMAGFAEAARDEASRKKWAHNIARMVEATGADGVDVDWEYPGGNGDDYKLVPNASRAWEIAAYPHLLAAVRAALGPDKTVCAAVPGLERDMLALTRETVPEVARQLDFLNVMTYEMLNRRDGMTKHHAGVTLSRTAVANYLARGVPAHQLNLGFSFCVKWARTRPGGIGGGGVAIPSNPRHPAVGRETVLLEDPVTGADTGNCAAFAWHDEVPAALRASFGRAVEGYVYDDEGGGDYYWDAEEELFWTFETRRSIPRKLDEVVLGNGLGGVFAWALGEDAPGFEHLAALNDAVANAGKKRLLEEDVRDEL